MPKTKKSELEKDKKSNTRGKRGHALGITKEQYAEALRICDGVKYRAAELLGVSRGRISQVCKKYKELQQICDDAINVLLDETQYQLLKGVRSGNRKDMKMVMQYYGHLRGLIPARDITSAGGPIGAPGPDDYDMEELEAAVAVLLHNPATLKLLDQVYLELENNADRRAIIDAEFSSVRTSKSNHD